MREFKWEGLRDALARAKLQRVVAVGAGGSHVSAAYLATCRRTLGHAGTVVQTPMEFVLDHDDLHDAEVWIFSASAENADAAATVRAARDRGCVGLVLCTRNPDGMVANLVGAQGGDVHVLPVADTKDGYLATHSLIATVVGLLLAAEALGGVSSIAALNALDHDLARLLDTNVRADRRRAVADLATVSTLLAIVDPRLVPFRSLIETSIWEAAICPVQVTDARNFGHGRHAWLHHYGNRTWILAATGDLSRVCWNSIESVLPSQVPVIVADYGDCGRLETVRSLIEGLGWIEAMGGAVGIDPGKPGTGTFARAMYDDDSLEKLAVQLSPPVRQKLAAAGQMGSLPPDVAHAASAWCSHVDGLCGAAIGGIVMDYDGTVVTTEGRFDPADAAIIAELVRLYHQGVVIAFASGRGKSLGRDLRDVLPSAMAAETVIGYYNGGHLRMASVDIETPCERPEPDPDINEVVRWIEAQPNLLRPCTLDAKEVQVAIRMSDLVRPQSFAEELSACPAIVEGRVRVVASAHSYDVVPSTSSKLRVVDDVSRRVGSRRAVLTIGDSGAFLGNDHTFLSRPHGISVGAVCGKTEGTWSLFGTRSTGPAALLKILRAIIPSEHGQIRLDRAALGIERQPSYGHRA